MADPAISDGQRASRRAPSADDPERGNQQPQGGTNPRHRAPSSDALSADRPLGLKMPSVLSRASSSPGSAGAEVERVGTIRLRSATIPRGGTSQNGEASRALKPSVPVVPPSPAGSGVRPRRSQPPAAPPGLNVQSQPRPEHVSEFLAEDTHRGGLPAGDSARRVGTPPARPASRPLRSAGRPASRPSRASSAGSRSHR
jgi:hypothetical protein